VVCGTGPLLFLNQGDGTFQIKRDAFKFAQPAQGTFTHAAVADYDRDGRLDIYFCTYMYYLGLDQYHYPIPYYDARNGPPNCLFHNEGNGLLLSATEETGLNADNDRYSFLAPGATLTPMGCQTCLWPTILAALSFIATTAMEPSRLSRARPALRRRRGDELRWCDFDNDGHQDVYVPSMWEAAGQRVSSDKAVSRECPERIFASSTSGTRAAMRSIEIRETGAFKTSAGKPASRWAAGAGPRISGISIMTVTPTSMSPMGIFPAGSE
jgi:hypothetical protein